MRLVRLAGPRIQEEPDRVKRRVKCIKKHPDTKGLCCARRSQPLGSEVAIAVRPEQAKGLDTSAIHFLQAVIDRVEDVVTPRAREASGSSLFQLPSYGKG